MAATLPPINGSAKGSRQNIQHFMPTPPKGPPSGKKLKPLRKVPGTADRDIFNKPDVLLQSQPELSKRQTASYRNTYKHNLCLDMLQQGYHKSFSELFALIKQQEEERLAQGPESLMWTMTLIKDQHEKLDMLKLYLTQAEEAHRKGDYGEVYRNRFELARYFQKTRDKWLADHFFTTCLQTSTEVEGDQGKMQAQGHYNVGVALEENGEMYTAADHFEAYYKLSMHHPDWRTSDDTSFELDACNNLWRIYTTIGTSLADDDEAEKCLEYLGKAHGMAKESMNRDLEGLASFTLGSYEMSMSGDGEAALQHLTTYLDICTASGDSKGVGKACDAISKAYAKQGKLEKSIDYLKRFVEVAEKSGEDVAYSKACHNLGNIFNTLGRYDEATDYFSKAYNISRTLADSEAINTNRVQFGIAMAHKMLGGLSTHVVQESRPVLERLIEWKSARTDEFEKPIPEPSSEEEDGDKSQQPSEEDTKKEETADSQS